MTPNTGARRYSVDEIYNNMPETDMFVTHAAYAALEADHNTDQQILEQIYDVLDGLPFREKVEGKPYSKHLSVAEQIKQLRADNAKLEARVKELCREVHDLQEGELNEMRELRAALTRERTAHLAAFEQLGVMKAQVKALEEA